MADRDAESRTQQPTLFRREEARRRGNVARSRDLTAALGLVGAGLLLKFAGPDGLESAASMERSFLGDLYGGASRLTPEGLSRLAAAGGGFLLLVIVPVALATNALVIGAQVLQGGLGLHGEALRPDLARLSPVEGFRRLLGLRGAARGLFCLAKLLIVAFLLAGAAGFLSGDLPASSGSLEASWEAVMGLAGRLAPALVCLGVLDYAVQRWLHDRDLRMTRAEVLEEISRLEGDPELRRRRRRAWKGFSSGPGPAGEGGEP